MLLEKQFNNTLTQVFEYLKETRFPQLETNNFYVSHKPTEDSVSVVARFEPDENDEYTSKKVAVDVSLSVVAKVNSVKVTETVEEEWEVGEIRIASKSVTGCTPNLVRRDLSAGGVYDNA